MSWGRDGGLVAYTQRAELDCSGFRRILDDRSGTTEPYSCELPNDQCYPNWQPELEAVLALLGSDGVQQELARSPILYGRDPRGVDGTVFQIRVGDALLDIGIPCDELPSDDCVETPGAIEELANALRRLERHAALDCSPECQPVPSSGDGSCSEERYYWMYDECVPATQRSCETGYATQQECIAAHRHCLRLYEQRCGGLAGGPCAEGDYCAYRQRGVCGVFDEGAICLPKPRICDDNVEEVCGCNNQTYPNLCEMARAGIGQVSHGACE